MAVSVELVRAHLAARRDSSRAAEAAHGVDLCVAAAAAAGDDVAADVVSAWLEAELPAVTARLRCAPAECAELAQLVRTHVLVGADGRPAIADYAAQGPLGAWLRVTALRKGLNFRRDERRHGSAQPDERLLEGVSSASEDPELRLLRERCREELKRAFGRAVLRLEPSERTLLRQSFLDGLNDAQLGALHGVHRTTVLRWIQRAQESLMRLVKKELERELKLSADELESMVRLLGSHLHITLRGHL
jgi:RNA polymerase sigma-70 factor (ECF subfamily)